MADPVPALRGVVQPVVRRRERDPHRLAELPGRAHLEDVACCEDRSGRRAELVRVRVRVRVRARARARARVKVRVRVRVRVKVRVRIRVRVRARVEVRIRVRVGVGVKVVS